jgi:hypothetical protein
MQRPGDGDYGLLLQNTAPRRDLRRARRLLVGARAADGARLARNFN